MTAQDHERLARFSRMVELHLKRVGRAIEIRRLELGLSRPQLARLIPVADRTIERWEKGQSGGADVQLDRVAEVMQTTSQAMLIASLAEEEQPERNGDGLMDALSAEEADAPLAADASDAEKLDRILAQQGRLLAEIGKVQVALRIQQGTRQLPDTQTEEPGSG